MIFPGPPFPQKVPQKGKGRSVGDLRSTGRKVWKKLDAAGRFESFFSLSLERERSAGETAHWCTHTGVSMFDRRQKFCDSAARLDGLAKLSSRSNELEGQTEPEIKRCGPTGVRNWCINALVTCDPRQNKTRVYCPPVSCVRVRVSGSLFSSPLWVLLSALPAKPCGARSVLLYNWHPAWGSNPRSRDFSPSHLHMHLICSLELGPSCAKGCYWWRVVRKGPGVY